MLGYAHRRRLAPGRPRLRSSGPVDPSRSLGQANRKLSCKDRLILAFAGCVTFNILLGGAGRGANSVLFLCLTSLVHPPRLNILFEVGIDVEHEPWMDPARERPTPPGQPHS